MRDMYFVNLLNKIAVLTLVLLMTIACADSDKNVNENKINNKTDNNVNNENHNDETETTVITEAVENDKISSLELTSSGGINFIVLNWNTVKADETYTIMRRHSSGEHEVLLEDIDGTELTDHAVELNEVYYYVVVAKETDGTTQYSNEVATFLINADLDKNKLLLEWAMIDNIVTYKVKRGTFYIDDDELEMRYNEPEVMMDLTDNTHEATIPADGGDYYYIVEAITDDETISSTIISIDKDFIDTDGDGLPDYVEIELGSDVNNPDTNNNGIPDGYEYYTLQSDPADLHSTIANEDPNDDGLTNLEEYLLETDNDEVSKDNVNK